MKALIPMTHTEYRLHTLQCEWQNAMRTLQMVSRDIAEHPEWGLVVGANGPQLQTSHQTPSKSALTRLQELANTNEQN